MADFVQLQKLLNVCVDDPYTLLNVEPCTQDIDTISKNYNRLMAENQDNDTMKDKLASAYSILTNENLKKIYDHEIKRQNQQQVSSVPLYIKLSIVTFLSWPLSKIATRVNSSKSIKSQREVVKEIIQQKGITGFFSGSTFIYMTGVGLLNSVIDTITYQYITPKALPKQVFYVLDTIVPPALKCPQLLVLDLLNIAPLSFTVFDIINKVILRRDTGNGGCVWKNFIFGIGTNISIWASKSVFEHLLKSAFHYIKVGAKKNPNSKLYRILNGLIDNIYVRSSITSLVYLPLEIIRTQNARILMDNYLYNRNALPIAMNPVSIVIDLYKSSGAKRFISGYLAQYLVVLVEEFGAVLDSEFVSLTTMDFIEEEDIN